MNLIIIMTTLFQHDSIVPLLWPLMYQWITIVHHGRHTPMEIDNHVLYLVTKRINLTAKLLLLVIVCGSNIYIKPQME